MTHELSVGQAIRLKGRPTHEEVAAAAGVDPATVEEVVSALVEAGHVVEKGDRVRLTPEGKERITALVAQERDGLDAERLESIHERFVAVNAEFKAIASDWQQKDGEPNDHADAAYDAAVLARLDDVDARLQPLLAELAEAMPRTAPYAGRFRCAMEGIRSGDHQWLLHPLRDSYHTVWFELHEELIQATGRNRADEAAAGRGA